MVTDTKSPLPPSPSPKSLLVSQTQFLDPLLQIFDFVGTMYLLRCEV